MAARNEHEAVVNACESSISVLKWATRVLDVEEPYTQS
jgi:hypothetical protein